jgi:hypothetical protein
MPRPKPRRPLRRRGATSGPVSCAVIATFVIELARGQRLCVPVARARSADHAPDSDRRLQGTTLRPMRQERTEPAMRRFRVGTTQPGGQPDERSAATSSPARCTACKPALPFLDEGGHSANPADLPRSGLRVGGHALPQSDRGSHVLRSFDGCAMLIVAQRSNASVRLLARLQADPQQTRRLSLACRWRHPRRPLRRCQKGRM